jgi:hypothetical protein
VPPADASPASCATDRARELVAEGAAHGLRLRVLGGVAVALRTNAQTPQALRRPSNDLDLAVEEGQGRRADEVLRASGLTALSERFNALHGHRRLVFVGEGAALKVDVFVGDLEMCHVVPLKGRLQLDPVTLSATDLLLSKGQIAKLTAKDRLDIYSLLWNHELDVAGGESADAVDGAYIAALCARDWGWWRTLGANVATCLRLLGDVALAEGDRGLVHGRLTALSEAIDAAPKSLRWRARSRVGERVRWYEEPEEIDGGEAAAPLTESASPGSPASGS